MSGFDMTLIMKLYKQLLGVSLAFLIIGNWKLKHGISSLPDTVEARPVDVTKELSSLTTEIPLYFQTIHKLEAKFKGRHLLLSDGNHFGVVCFSCIGFRETPTPVLKHLTARVNSGLTTTLPVIMRKKMKKWLRLTEEMILTQSSRQRLRHILKAKMSGKLPPKVSHFKGIALLATPEGRSNIKSIKTERQHMNNWLQTEDVQGDNKNNLDIALVLLVRPGALHRTKRPTHDGKAHHKMIAYLSPRNTLEFERISELHDQTLGEKYNSRRLRRAIDEAEDLAVLMGQDTPENKEKMAEMIASDFSKPEVLDKDMDSERATSVRNAFKASSDKIEDLMKTLRTQEGLGTQIHAVKNVSTIRATKKPHKSIHGLAFIESSWGPWTLWSECSVKCGKGGFRVRKRSCDTLPDVPCKGANSDTSPCNEEDACIAEWKPWSDWGPCSVTCGDGIRARSRTCISPDIDLRCKGKATGFQTCRKSSCEVHVAHIVPKTGQISGSKQKVAPMVVVGPVHQPVSVKGRRPGQYSWSQWSEWGRCSKTCGDGMASRSRQCLNGNVIPPMEVKPGLCGGGGTWQRIGCRGDCSGHTSIVAGSGPIDAGMPAAGSAAAGSAAASGMVVQTKNTRYHEETSYFDGYEAYLTPETIIFIILLIAAVLLFIVALCIWACQRSHAAKVRREIKALQPFYKTKSPGDDDSPGGLGSAKIRQVYNYEHSRRKAMNRRSIGTTLMPRRR